MPSLRQHFFWIVPTLAALVCPACTPTAAPAGADAHPSSLALPAWATPSTTDPWVTVGSSQYASIWQVQHRGAKAYVLYSADDAVEDGSDDLYDAGGNLLCHVRAGQGVSNEDCPLPADAGTRPVFVWAARPDTSPGPTHPPRLNCSGCNAAAPSFAPWLASNVAEHEGRTLNAATHEIWRIGYRGQTAFLLVRLGGDDRDLLFTDSGAPLCTWREARKNGATSDAFPTCDRRVDAGAVPVLMWRHPDAPRAASDPFGEAAS